MVRRQIHIDNLRSANPKTLEILIQDAVRKPILQLSPQTFCDLLALSELDSLPKGVSRDLAAFAKRAEQGTSDLPDGSVLTEFLEGLEKVEAAHVPDAARTLVQREAERESRENRARQKAQALVDGWADTPAEAPVLSEQAPAIHRGEDGPERPEPTRGARIATDKKKKSSKKATSSSSHSDPEREKWLSQTIVEKLVDYRDAGLAEAVLIAGIRHAAQDQYPDLMPFEVTKALRTLADNGQVRHSAGRWSSTLRSY